MGELDLAIGKMAFAWKWQVVGSAGMIWPWQVEEPILLQRLS